MGLPKKVKILICLMTVKVGLAKSRNPTAQTVS